MVNMVLYRAVKPSSVPLSGILPHVGGRAPKEGVNPERQGLIGLLAGIIILSLRYSNGGFLSCTMMFLQSS